MTFNENDDAPAVAPAISRDVAAGTRVIVAGVDSSVLGAAVRAVDRMEKIFVVAAGPDVAGASAASVVLTPLARRVGDRATPFESAFAVAHGRSTAAAAWGYEAAKLVDVAVLTLGPDLGRGQDLDPVVARANEVIISPETAAGGTSGRPR